MPESIGIRDLLKKTEVIAPLLPENIEVEVLLAEGGQGVVYRGKVNGKEEAAVKIYFPGAIHGRIEREINGLKALNCGNIVRLLWWTHLELEGYQLPVVATSMVPGSPLSEIKSEVRMVPRFLSQLTVDVCSAIGCMWERRIVHRDLKPSNILIMPTGRACVIDLGLARHVEMSTLTAAGATWGTLGYLSPEQTRGVKQLTCKSDVFALGVILLECAIGRHPSAGDQLRLLARRFHEQLPDVLSEWEHSAILRRMLHPRPTSRPKPEQIIAELSKSPSG